MDAGEPLDALSTPENPGAAAFAFLPLGSKPRLPGLFGHAVVFVRPLV